jgi:hypothetical protein
MALFVSGMFIAPSARGDPLNPNSYGSLGALSPASGSVTFDTDSLTVSGAFSGMGALQAQGAGLPSIAVFTFSSINVPTGVTVNIIGSRPIAILSQGDAMIGTLNVSAFGTTGRVGGGSGGAQGLAGQGPGGGQAPVFPNSGGSGGGFGGIGGSGANQPAAIGGSSYGDLAAALQGGSGGAGGQFAGAAGGAGGGAIEIGAVGALHVGSVSANGAASVSQLANPTAGGGSGGAILLHAAVVTGGSALASGGVGGRASGTLGAGGDGGGGRVLLRTGAYTLNSQIPIAGVGLNNRSGVAQFQTQLTVMPSGVVRELGSGGTFLVTPGGYSTYETDALQVNSGALAFSSTAISSSHDLRLQGGLVSASSGWTSTGSAQLSGFGQVMGTFVGGGGNSIVASGGVMTIGDANSTAGFTFSGTTTVLGGATLQLQDSDRAILGSATTLQADGRLASLNGVLLSSGQTLTATGSAVVEGNFTNQGTVNGPSESGQFLTFADGVNGAGNFSGNTRFSGVFAPGNSPAVVTFAGNTVLDASSITEMELGGTIAGSGYDKIVVDGLLTLGGGRLDVLYWEGFSAAAGNVFDLFDWGSLAGTFGSISLPTLTAGLSWDISRLYADGTVSVIGVAAPIPEPETYAMLLAGLGLLGFEARRRKQLQHATA